MEFDMSRIYTAVNADELTVGSICFFESSVGDLRKMVAGTYNNCCAQVLKEVRPDIWGCRFVNNDGEAYPLAYLLEQPNDKTKPRRTNKTTNNYTYTEKEMRTKKYKCRDVCPTWNRQDRDCEIYGETHPTPLQCPYFAHHIRDKKCVCEN